MALKAPKMKRGDTFLYTITGQDVLGQDVVLDDYDLEAQIRDQEGTFSATLLVTKIPGTAHATLEADYADTSEWPLGDLVFDVQFTKLGKRVSTVTIVQTVLEDVTHTP